MTPAQERMLEVLNRLSARDREKGGEGWADYSRMIDEWGSAMPVYFIASAAVKTFKALRRRGLVEDHPDHCGLVRSKVTP